MTETAKPSAEILRPDFGRRPTKVEGKVCPAPGSGRGRIAKLMEEYGIKDPRMRALIIIQHLAGLMGSIPKQLIQVQQNIVRGYTNEDIKSLIFGPESNELTWNMKPAFFWALAQEARQRTFPAEEES